MKTNKLPDDKGIILYVDDEPKNLTSFKAVFRRHYRVYVAESAQEGIEVMKNNAIQLVITDQRMPNITGVEFLEKIAHKYPDVTRIILTGYSDVEAIINAINKGQVYKYITKPWKKDELKLTIDNALEAFQLRQENQRLIENLQKTNEELDSFVYSASHDLRSPVTTLMGLINALKYEKNPEEIKNLISMQDKTVKKLDSFIQDIINYSRNERQVLQKQDIVFSEIIQKILEQYQNYNNSTEIEKIVNIKQEVSFVSDKVRLQIVLENLINNAIRYNPLKHEKPYLKIDITVEEEEAQIEIVDNGCGIEEEHLPKIFDMFYRATSENHGAGLGLFLVKESLNKVGGKIEVESNVKEGSIFRIQVPNFSKNI